MANPLDLLASDNADVDLDAGATIFSEANASGVNRWVALDIEIGDGSKDLDATGDTTLTLQVSNGGVLSDTIEVTVPGSQDRFRKLTDPMLWINGETLALTCSSSNSSDTDVDATVTAYDAAPLQPAVSGRTIGIESDGDVTKVNTLDGHTPQSEDHAAAIAAIDPLDSTETQAAAAAALTAYDPPTKTELDTAQSAIINAVQAVNTGAARYIAILTNAAYELPDSGSVAYPIEIRTFDADGEPVAIDSAADPTVTVTRTTDAADLSGNLSAISNPATGVYRMTLTITEGSDVVAPVRIDASGTIDSTSRSTSAYPVVTDAVAVDFTAADRVKLDALHDDRLTAGRAAALDNLDAAVTSRAAPGDEMDLVDAPNETAVTTIQDGLATEAKQDTITDEQRYALAVLIGAISNPQTATEEYVITLGGSTYTVTCAALESDGTRGTTTLAKT